MTDASGQFAIAGLAEGEYTVAISDYDDVAYVFDNTSMDVDLGDDDTQIVNFMGTHARTASVTVRMFVDELSKNNLRDEGEHAFPSAQMLAEVPPQNIPVLLAGLKSVVTLAGPGVLDTNDGQVMPDGSFVFAGLKAGDYQLVVNDMPAELLAALPQLRDYAYGGEAQGYEIELAVGQAEAQDIPIDITHTTINFGVFLKHGAEMGHPLPGATVTLYSDPAGTRKIDDETTGTTGAASIRIARAGTTGNTVYGAVAAPAGPFHTSGAMQPVMWDPQYPATPPVTNDADIVNTMASFSFSGATVDRGDYGGGKVLGGWTISVTSDKGLAIDTVLNSNGIESYSENVMPDSLPVTYTVAVDDDQANARDGGELYESTELTYTHDGLSLPAEMNAGQMVVTYTTQTLKIYVHHERDQVEGYTGNVFGGDVRRSGTVDVAIRHIDRSDGRSREFTTEQWNPDPGLPGSSGGDNMTDSHGVVTFKRVPADAQVIVQAKVKPDADAKLVSPDELAAYTDPEGNGIMGGAFGDNGGFHHTVELCPLEATDPTGQDHGECASFAFVSTYSVSGLVWKRAVEKDGDDFEVKDPVFVSEINVSLDPVEGKNLGGEKESATTTEKPVRQPGETSKGTEILDETHEFDFGNIAAGVYGLSVSPGWRYRIPADGDELGEKSPKGATGSLGNALNPLAGDLAIDVTPATATVYGRVDGTDGFPLDSVKVTINGQEVETDEYGRYIVDGIRPTSRRVRGTWYSSRIFVDAVRPGFDDASTMVLGFASNSVTRNDFDIKGTAEFATVTGTVTVFGSDTEVEGVEIRVNDGAPLNPNAKSSSDAEENDIYVTGKVDGGTDGDYEIKVTPTAAGETVTITAHKDGYTFTPASLQLSAPKDAKIAGINFQAVANSTIRGRVQNPDGDGPLSGVEVTVMGNNGSDTDTTGTTGNYSLSVPAGTYTLAFAKEGYSFTEPAGGWDVTVGLGQTVTFAQVESTKDPDAPSEDATLSALSLSEGTLDPAFASDVDEYTADVGVDVDTVMVTATANDATAEVEITPADADEDEAGHQVELNAAGTDTEITVTVTAEDGTTEMAYTVTVSRSDGHMAPSAPRSFAVTPGDQSATMTWEAPLQIGSSAITGYDWEASAPGQLTRSGTLDPATTTPVDGVFTQELASPNLVNGVTYTFSVWAVNQKGETGSEVDVRGPAATEMAKAQPVITMALSSTTLAEDPTSASDTATVTITLSNPSIEDITVTVEEMFAEGDDDQISQVDITNPTIEIAAGSTTAAAGTDATTITAIDDVVDDDDANALVQATATNAIDSDADTGTEGLQPASITITDDDTVAGAPRNLTVTAGNAELMVEWISPATLGSSTTILRYQIRHALTANIDDADWETATSGVVLSGLTNSSEYTVQVRAVTAAGNGAAASETGTPSSSE